MFITANTEFVTSVLPRGRDIFPCYAILLTFHKGFLGRQPTGIKNRFVHTFYSCWPSVRDTHLWCVFAFIAVCLFAGGHSHQGRLKRKTKKGAFVTIWQLWHMPDVTRESFQDLPGHRCDAYRWAPGWSRGPARWTKCLASGVDCTADTRSWPAWWCCWRTWSPPLLRKSR